MDLDERKAAILKAVVEEHIHTAQPVGSQTIARSRGLKVSSATVRNEMTVLEREGYLVQPHTSAGRIPTDRGYRYFVDHLTQQAALAPAQRRGRLRLLRGVRVGAPGARRPPQRDQPAARPGEHAHRRGRRARNPTPRPCAACSSCRSSRRSCSCSRSCPTAASRSACCTSPTTSPTRRSCRACARRARRAARRVSVGSAPRGHGHERRRAVDTPRAAKHATRWRRAGEHESGEPLYVGGASRLAAEQEAFPTPTSAAQLLELLEHQVEVVSLVRDLLDEGATVSIGSENPRDELRDCSIVVAPYLVEGEVIGTVGVLGPDPHGLPPGARGGRSHLRSAGQGALVTDYYEVLGITRQRPTTRSSARTAAQARRYHPDNNGGDPAAEAQFKEVSIAYETLRDPERRRRYDVFGEDGTRRASSSRGSGRPVRLRRHLRRVLRRRPVRERSRQAGPPRAPDAEAVVNLDLPQAAFGTTASVEVRLPVSCVALRGLGLRARHASGALRRVRGHRRGARGTALDPRPDHDRGAVRRVQRHRQPHSHAVPRLPRRRSRALVAHDRRRGARRCRRRPAPAPRRAAARPRRAAASPATSTSPCASRPTSGSSARVTTSCTPGASRSRRRRSVRGSTSRPSRAPRSSIVHAGHATGSRVPAQGPRRARAPWPRARRPARARRRRRSRAPHGRGRRAPALACRHSATRRSPAPQEKGVFSRLRSAFQ